MKPLILAIDDSKAIRFLLQTILGKKYQVVTAADAASAMFWLSKKNFPELILADAQLPDMENWELIANLKSSYIYREIPMVVISSLSMEHTESNCRQLGVDKFFLKPFNPIHLIETIDQLVSEKVPGPHARFPQAI